MQAIAAGRHSRDQARSVGRRGGEQHRDRRLQAIRPQQRVAKRHQLRNVQCVDQPHGVGNRAKAAQRVEAGECAQQLRFVVRVAVNAPGRVQGDAEPFLVGESDPSLYRIRVHLDRQRSLRGENLDKEGQLLIEPELGDRVPSWRNPEQVGYGGARAPGVGPWRSIDWG
ncbi:MAG: hypothetical protein ABSG43_23720 [Solirubrobacteraceae bacterium]